VQPILEKAMNKNVLFVLLLCGLQSAAYAQIQTQSHRKTLDQPTEIQGYPCDKEYAWFYAAGRLQRCLVSREIAFGEAKVPVGSIVELLPDGMPKYAMLSHEAPVAGILCMGGSWLGPGEGATTAFYPSGKLKQCFLAGDQTVQGVPCMKGGILGDGTGSGAEFHENGKLKSCKLTKDFGGQRKGERFLQTP
jgi:hypothetical protein